MLLDELNTQIQNLKQQLEELIQKLQNLTKVFDFLKDACDGITSSSSKIEEWEEAVFQNNREMAARITAQGTLFGEYHMKHIQQIMKDGKVADAIEELQSMGSSVSTARGNVGDQITQLQSMIDTCKNSIGSVTSQIQSLVDK